jgi:hypothetical protein
MLLVGFICWVMFMFGFAGGGITPALSLLLFSLLVAVVLCVRCIGRRRYFNAFAISWLPMMAVFVMSAIEEWHYPASRTPFKDEKAFATYVSNLNLEGLTPDSARARLVEEGFSCPSYTTFVLCERKASSTACHETQSVKIKISDAGGISVQPSLWYMCGNKEAVGQRPDLAP